MARHRAVEYDRGAKGSEPVITARESRSFSECVGQANQTSWRSLALAVFKSQSKKAKKQPKSRSVLGRVFWAALLILHLAALPASWSSFGIAWSAKDWGTPAIRTAGLLLTAAFFILKVLDVAWLRLMPGWRSGVAAVTVVALIHVNVLESGGVERLPNHCMGLVATCLVGAALEQNPRGRNLLEEIQRRVLAVLFSEDPKPASRTGWTREREFNRSEVAFIQENLAARPPPPFLLS
ncbi:MAG: hypothetical protein AABZ47_07545 [Planctomycetota bacterium]